MNACGVGPLKLMSACNTPNALGDADMWEGVGLYVTGNRSWQRLVCIIQLDHFHASACDPVQDSSHNSLDHHNEGYHDEDVMPLKTRGATSVLKG